MCRFEMKVPNPDAITAGRVVEQGFTQNDQATATVRQRFHVIGIVYYYPRNSGKLSRPGRKDWERLLEETPNMDPAVHDEDAATGSSGRRVGGYMTAENEDSDDDLDVDIVDHEQNESKDGAEHDEGVFDVYWQKRLVPNSVVKRLPFFPVIRSYADAERVCSVDRLLQSA